MEANQTTASGEQLTLITGMGGQPATRASIERLCRTKSAQQHKDEQHRSKRSA